MKCCKARHGPKSLRESQAFMLLLQGGETMAAVTLLWDCVTCAVESQPCPEQKPEGAGAKRHQAIVYAQEMNSEWLRPAYFSCAFSDTCGKPSELFIVSLCLGIGSCRHQK